MHFNIETTNQPQLMDEHFSMLWNVRVLIGDLDGGTAREAQNAANGG